MPFRLSVRQESKPKFPAHWMAQSFLEQRRMKELLRRGTLEWPTSWPKMGKGVASLAQQYYQVSSAAGHSKAWDRRAYTVQPFHIVEDHCLYFFQC